MAGHGPSHVCPSYGRTFLLSCIVFVTLLFVASTTAAVTRTARFIDAYGSIDTSMTVEDQGLVRVVYRQFNGVAARIRQYGNNRVSFEVDTTKWQSFTNVLALENAVLSQPCDSTGPCLIWYEGGLYDLAAMEFSMIDSSMLENWSTYLLSSSFSSAPGKIVTGASNSQVMLLIGTNLHSLDSYNVPLPDSEEFNTDFQGKVVDVGISNHHSRVCILTHDGLMGCWGFFEAAGQPPTMWQPHLLNEGTYFAAAYQPPYRAISLVDTYMCMATVEIDAVRCFGAFDEFAISLNDFDAVKIAGGPGYVCIVRSSGQFHCESPLIDLANLNAAGSTFEVRDVFALTDKVQFITPPDSEEPEERCKYYLSLPNGYHFCTMVGGTTPRRSIRWTTDPGVTLPKEIYADFKAVYELTLEGTNYHVVTYSNGHVGVLTADADNTIVADLSDAIVSEPCNQLMCAVYSRSSGGVLNVLHAMDESTAAALSAWTGEEVGGGGGTGGEGEGGGGGTGGEGERWSKKQDHSLLTPDVSYLASARGILCAINGGPIACRGYGMEGAINVVHYPPEGRAFTKAIIVDASQVIALLDNGNLYVMSLYNSDNPYTSPLSSLLGLDETVVDIASHVDGSSSFDGRWCLISSGGSIWCAFQSGNTYLESSPERDDRWDQLSMSYNYVCARGNRGEWRCWGEFSTDYAATPEYVPTELKSRVVQRVIAMPSYITLIACDQTGVDQFECGVPCVYPSIPETSANKALINTNACGLQCSGHWTRPDLGCSVCGLAPSPGKVDTGKCECLPGWTGANCQTPCTLEPELGRYDVNYQTCSKVCIPPYHGADCDNTEIRHSTFWMPVPSDGLRNPAALTGITYKPAHKAFARGLLRTAFFTWPDGTKARAELYDHGVLQVVSRTSSTVLLRSNYAVIADTCSYSTTWSNNNWICMIYYDGVLHDLSSGRNIRYMLDYVPEQIAVSTVNNNFLTLDEGRVRVNGRTRTPANLPTSGISQIALYGDYGAALTSSGSVWVWNVTASSPAQLLDNAFSSAITNLSAPFTALSARSGVCVVSSAGKAGCIDASGDSWLEFSGTGYTDIVSGWTFACATSTTSVNCQGSITLQTSTGTQTYSYADRPASLSSSVAVHADLYWAQFNRLPQPLSVS